LSTRSSCPDRTGYHQSGARWLALCIGLAALAAGWAWSPEPAVVGAASDGRTYVARPDGSTWLVKPPDAARGTATLVKVEGLPRVTSVSFMGARAYALGGDGALWTWPLNAPGRVSRRDDVADLRGLSCGARHCLVLRSDGSVFAFGAGDRGQLGDGTRTDAATAVLIDGLVHVTAVAAGGDHSLALTAAGEIYSWGAGDYGALGLGGSSDEPAPANVNAKVGRPIAIAAGRDHSLVATADGSLWGFGSDGERQLGGIGTTDTPSRIKSITGVRR
jgi:hypothetical protein